MNYQANSGYPGLLQDLYGLSHHRRSCSTCREEVGALWIMTRFDMWSLYSLYSLYYSLDCHLNTTETSFYGLKHESIDLRTC